MASMNFVTFNQDHSLLGVGTTKGFRVYHTDPFAKSYETREGDVAIIEMLFSTSLVALILAPRMLRIQNTKRNSTICELTFPTRVLAVKLNRKRLVVVLEDQIYMYDISNMNLLHVVDTSPNPNAICALSPSSEHNYLVYPLPQRSAAQPFQTPAHAPPSSSHVPPTTGEVMIFDATRMEPLNVAEAHKSPLSYVAINTEGTLLATSSEKGTIIRVFSLPDAQNLYSFRRGSIPARIYSMSFNSTSTLLCVSSATETVHIFRLTAANHSHSRSNSVGSGSRPNLTGREHSNSPSSEEAPGFSEYEANDDSAPRRAINPSFGSLFRRTSQNIGKTIVATAGGYLPKAVAEVWEPSRDFAWVKVPKSTNPHNLGPLRTVVAMSNNGPQVMVVTSEGKFYVFTIDLEKGGEGTLSSQFSILDPSDRLGSLADD